MVYCGKPSKGCSNCRERKIRCDQREPRCGQCEKRQQQCPGYRNLVDLMFRDESSHVIKKARAKARKRGTPTSGLEPGTISPETETRLSLTPEPPRGKRSLSLIVPTRPRVSSSPAHRDDDDDDDESWSNNDSSLLMSPDSGSWPSTPPMALLYNLAPTCQERGTAYFFSRYVTINETACHQRFDFVYEVWKPSLVPDRQVDGVLASMTAVGLMGLASMTRSEEMMEAARKSYGTALRLTNAALTNDTEATKDTTMLSVLILGLFEMMAENTPQTRTVKAFQEHVNGAATLAKVRGPEQFRTKAGVKMFSMLCQRVMISCIQKEIPMPQALLDLREEMNKTLDPGDPRLQISPLMYECLKVRCDIKRGEMTEPEAIIRRLLGIEDEFVKLVARLAPSWHYRIFRVTRHHPAIFRNTCHLYPSVWHANVWNATRSTRILILETILSEIHKELQNPLPRLSDPSWFVKEFNKAKRQLERMVDAICASVPQHLGLVNPVDGSIETASTPISSVEVRETPSPPTSPAARSNSTSSSDSPAASTGSNNKGAHSSPGPRRWPTGLTILDITKAKDAEDEAARFMLLVSATSTVVWPLYMIGMSSVCTDEMKAYAVDRLRTLYMETGIRQADAVANLLEEHEVEVSASSSTLSAVEWLVKEEQLVLLTEAEKVNMDLANRILV
ncbi:sterol uptake control protein 2 [Diplogelasinospora grovesii]|uniref:Sterol uptake control protein 2 n=1 Tax=Diplogelasinospora grovesii TaxID=303347 RepID=A0AAN6NFQ4_9PEZI|nr:sterol uptake control protein 2 [Diplogelasinospora grovesii]